MKQTERWYVLSSFGCLPLCTNEHDARESASQYDVQYPQNAPHIVAQARMVGDGDRERSLADALDHIARVASGSRSMTKRTAWILARAKSALNGDDDWKRSDKPAGYHDNLERYP